MRTYFLLTKRLGFSIWQEDDLPLANSLWSQPEVSHYICANHIFTKTEIEKRLQTEIDNYKKYQVQYFPIFNLENNDLVGCCGIRPFDNPDDVFELGIHLKKEYWHQGYAQESGEAMIKYAFNCLNLNELKAGHNPQNDKSKKMLEKLGFVFESENFYKPTGLFHPTYSLKK